MEKRYRKNEHKTSATLQRSKQNLVLIMNTLLFIKKFSRVVIKNRK